VPPEDLHSNTTHGVVVTEATEATPALLDALHHLVPQLSSSASPLTPTELEEIVGSEATILLVARDGGGRIVGTLSLIVFRAPTGLRAWIEDVVVDDDTRGLGVGAALVRAGIARGRAAGAQTVDLTSRPSREEANRLYVREGFVQRTTNVYRFDTTIEAQGHRGEEADDA
jgi:ribosomal protein S18 acetylase RimI-like enzyme